MPDEGASHYFPAFPSGLLELPPLPGALRGSGNRETLEHPGGGSEMLLDIESLGINYRLERTAMYETHRNSSNARRHRGVVRGDSGLAPT